MLNQRSTTYFQKNYILLFKDQSFYIKEEVILRKHLTINFTATLQTCT